MSGLGPGMDVIGPPNLYEALLQTQSKGKDYLEQLDVRLTSCLMYSKLEEWHVEL